MRPPAVLRLVVLVAVAMFAAAFAGCAGDGVEVDGPVSLIEAYREALPHATSLAPSAHLVGFVGHEGAPPTFLRGLLGDHVVARDTSGDPQHADGRALAWNLLFASVDGGLLRVSVLRSPSDVMAEWVSDNRDPLLAALWSLNLGGRLLVDSPAALASITGQDPAIRRHVREHPNGIVVYASTLANDPDRGTEDLVYEVFFGAEDGGTSTYAFYAQVSHWSGKLLAAGDHANGERRRTVTLAEASFTLDPLHDETWGDYATQTTVFGAALTLDVSGNGSFTLELARDNASAIVSISDQLVSDARSYRSSLGTLAPGSYGLHATATGRIGFAVRVDGVMVL